MPAPGPQIPPEILDALERQRQALAEAAPRHEAALLAIATDLQDELEAQLRARAPGRFTTQQTRVILAQARAITDILGAEYGERLGRESEAIGRFAARVGRDGLFDQITAWRSRFPGLVEQPERARLAADVLDPGLLEYYAESRSRYGADAISRMRVALARAQMSGETLQQTSERLAREFALPSGRAETIVRTEQSFALHRRQIEDARALDLGLAKRLVAVHDNRTGHDSIFVDGQTRGLDEPFSDNLGHVYQHPPNRPNDRETVVFVPAGFAEGAEAEPGSGEDESQPLYSSRASAGPQPSKEDLEIFDRMRRQLGVKVRRGPDVDAEFDLEPVFPCDGRFIPTAGRPGLIKLREKASRTTYYEEIFHARQHAARGLRKPTQIELATDEIEAQEFLIEFGKGHGWSDEELRQHEQELRLWTGVKEALLSGH